MRAVAFYLPQFHRIAENDAWWGEGFTEWTNVVRGQPEFRGHYQPHLPGALGFYNLLNSEVREAQATLAQDAGIDAFCYYHYWFEGRRLLHEPLDKVLRTASPDFPFCLCWANENWTRRWDGLSKEMLIEQTYSPTDDLAHIRWLAGIFADPRYVRINDKPLFLVYRAAELPDPLATTQTWRAEAVRLGIGELHLVRVDSYWEPRIDPAAGGFDAAVEFQPDGKHLPPRLRVGRGWRFTRAARITSPAYERRAVFSYPQLVDAALASEEPDYTRYRCVTPGWDNSVRRPKEGGWIFRDASPAVYERWLSQVVAREQSRGVDLVFLNAWNEWAEGNHLEPCEHWETAYLEATARVLVSGGQGRRHSHDISAPAPAPASGVVNPSPAPGGATHLPRRVEIRLGETVGEYWRDRLASHVDDTYLGIPLVKFPEDLRVYEHLLWLASPSTVLELGAHGGGSALWFRDRLAVLERCGRITKPLVVSVDLDVSAAREAIGAIDPAFEETILLVEGDVRDPELPDQIARFLPAEATCLVSEDTAHTRETTGAALRGFARFVAPGGFLVVEDGVVDLEAVRPVHAWPRGVVAALTEWLATEDGADFVVRRDLELYGLTSHPWGYLQRRPR